MKYASKLYANALADVIEKTDAHDKDGVIKNFVRALQKNGDTNGVDKIYTELERIAIKKRGGRFIRLAFARPMPERLLSGVRELFGKEDRIDTIVDPALIAGVRITIDGERELDGTLAHKLNVLFKA